MAPCTCVRLNYKKLFSKPKESPETDAKETSYFLNTRTGELSIWKIDSLKTVIISDQINLVNSKN
jgi:hypothetical protein